MQIILFDTDSKRRATMMERFVAEGHNVIECYSIDKLNLLLKRTEYPVIIVHESIRSELPASFNQEKICTFQTVDDLIHFRTENINVPSHHGIILIGSSTGGVPVVSSMIKGIELTNQSIIICQHIGPGELTQNLYDSLKKSSRSLQLVEQETSFKHGNVYLLAGGSDYQLKKKYNKLFIVPISDSASEYHPSFNTLVKSTLELDERSLVIILSGLGNDGSLCLKEARQKGIRVAVQDPSTAVAPFMPKAAIMSGQVDDVVTEDQLPDYLKKRVA